MYPHRPAETKIPQEHKCEKRQEYQNSYLHWKLEVENAKTYDSEAEETNEYVGDKHGAIVKAWLGFEFQAAIGASFIHHQGPG